MAIKYQEDNKKNSSEDNTKVTSPETIQSHSTQDSKGDNMSNGTFTADQLFQQQPQPRANPQPDNLNTSNNPTGVAGHFSWTNLGDLNQGLIAPSDASTNLGSLSKLLKEHIDNMDTEQAGINFDVLVVDKKNHYELQISAVVLIMTHATDDNASLVYRPLLIESSIENRVPRTEIVDNQQIEIPTFACDFADSTFLGIIHKEVSTRYPKHHKVTFGDAEVIFKDMDLERNPTTANTLLYNAGGAAILQWQNEKFASMIDLSKHVGGEELSQFVTYSKEQKVDAAGQPLRADIQLSVVATKLITDQYNRVRPDERQQVVGSATGYIDLIYNPTTPEYGPQVFGQSNPVVSAAPTYSANFVLTSLELNQIKTLPGLLCALINVSYIREQNNWLTALMPNTSYTEDNMHNIGAIGYDTDVFGDQSYRPISTSPTDFDPQKLGQIYDFFFHKGLAFSIDVPLCGSQTWQYRELLDAVNGDQGAINQIVDAADFLTGNNGYFKDLYYNKLGTKSSTPVFARDVKVLLGHYTSKDTGERDIRDLDYLAVAKFAGERGNMEEIHRYTDATLGAYNQVKADNVIHNLLSTYLGNITLTGYAKRIYFDGNFIEALVQAAKSCGYKVSGAMPYSGHHKQSRAVGDWVASSVMGNTNTSGIFINQRQQYNQPNGFHQNYPRY